MADFERFFKKTSKRENLQQNAPKPSVPPSHSGSPELASIERLLRKEKEEKRHSSLLSGDAPSTQPSSSSQSMLESAELVSIKHLMRKEKERRPSSNVPEDVPKDYDLNVMSTVMLDRELPTNPQTPDSALDSIALLLAKQAVG